MSCVTEMRSQLPRFDRLSHVATQDAPTMEYYTDIAMWNGGRVDSWNTARAPGMGGWRLRGWTTGVDVRTHSS